MTLKYAFRCKTCGHFHSAGHAAELPRPAACAVCGSGVVFRHAELAAKLLEEGADVKAIAGEIAKCDPASKRLVPENWEVLADAAHERLAELGLTHEHVERHTPWPKGGSDRKPVHVAVTANEATGVSDVTN